MKQELKILSVICIAVFIAVTLSSVSLAVDPKTLSPSTKAPGPGTIVALCADPAVTSFSVSKSLPAIVIASKASSGNTATFTMNGTICNNGAADYNQTDNPLEANFNVYAGYGPMFSYAAAGELKNFKQTIGSGLKKGQCMSFSQTYTRDHILQWGFREPKSNEKQMKLMFEFLVRDAKGTLGTSSQVKSFDCNAGNNINKNPQVIDMMIGPDMLQPVGTKPQPKTPQLK